ncbi:hypothetical protein [Janthinobacterium sp. B9-8]|uniref:hypothetical protein n=1 Tax=Janthinobacterium sp. B9-8 TaxID=1236179 RepID=UPI00061D2CFE|nr:hypothetical protein [Janthinobacterium sp. B9-8]AMC36609.1 hypothetical protein VN23_19445 [Janthinobacterium sp. B9-8]
MNHLTPHYQDLFPKQMLAYFRRNDAYSTVKALDGSMLYEPHSLPTFEGFASSIDVNAEILNGWASEKDDVGELKYPAFAYAHRLANNLQEDLLIQGGLVGSYNSEFAAFMLKTLHGWVE